LLILSVITLSLLHPIKQVPVQVWTFPSETTIRIGRSTDNQVILYSAVVSRHHVELRRVGANWEIVNLGTNGTYLDGKRITQVPVSDGAIIRLARSGPNIQIRIGDAAAQPISKPLTGDRTLGQTHEGAFGSTDITDPHAHEFDEIIEPDEEDEPPSSLKGIIPVPPHLQLPPDAPTGLPLAAPNSSAETSGVAIAPKRQQTPLNIPPPIVSSCQHERGGGLFCVDCGQPLQVLQTVGNYQLLKVLGQGMVGITYQGWRSGQHVVLKTLNTDWGNNSSAFEALECEAETLRYLNHLGLPQLVDFFVADDQPYLVTELIPGQTVTQYISTYGSVSTKQAIAWVMELCNILDYLHRFTPPILHRGIKPSSLIYQTLPQASDRLALVDFGAIKAMVLGLSLSAAGSTSYSAPEHLDVNATPTVDLYALGPLLAYLITGQNPIAFYFDREQGYRFYADAVPGISPDLIRVLHTLTQPDPEERYATPKDVANALLPLRDR
jgi:eukaryotic-like serine/threonine-protein kinase